LICTTIYYVLIRNKSFFYITFMKQKKFVFRLRYKPREAFENVRWIEWRGFLVGIGRVRRKMLKSERSMELMLEGP